MRAIYLQLFAAIALLVGTTAVTAAGPADGGIDVIMAAGTNVPHLGRSELAQIFKLRKRYWDDGQAIEPVNLGAAHALRRVFSQQVLGRSPEELEDYWRDRYFHGVLPPFVLGSEEAVLRFVAATPGAIGYVSHCQIDHRVTVVLHVEGGPPCPR
jgi:ABC-type phosphate transport system substrate-binding protein